MRKKTIQSKATPQTYVVTQEHCRNSEEAVLMMGQDHLVAGVSLLLNRRATARKKIS
jgi:hypothetical protein